MKGREKIEAAFSSAGTPEIAAVICYEGIYIRDRWDDLTQYPWWYRHAPEVDRQVAWRRETTARLGQDWMELPSSPARTLRERVVLEERADGVFWVDRLTGEKRELQRETIGGWPERYAQPSGHPDVFPLSSEQIDEQTQLPAEIDPVEVASSGRGDLARALLSEYGDDLFPIAHVAAPLWSSYNYWGFEGMMVTIANRPDLVEYACERLMAASVRSVRAAAARGAAGIWVEDCMTDMISSRAFARLNLPFVRRLVEEIRALGMSSIYYFCGNPAGKWEFLLGAGADALSLEEGKKGFEIDIEDVVEQARGRCTVLGNLDAIHLLEHGSEAELRTEIARQVSAGRRNGSRFIMSIGSPVTPGTTPEQVRLYCDLTHELGG